jgi:hypothetical protein
VNFHNTLYKILQCLREIMIFLYSSYGTFCNFFMHVLITDLKSAKFVQKENVLLISRFYFLPQFIMNRNNGNLPYLLLYPVNLSERVIL